MNNYETQPAEIYRKLMLDIENEINNQVELIIIDKINELEELYESDTICGFAEWYKCPVGILFAQLQRDTQENVYVHVE